jgi:selenocysteine lyase/cysteine desulfurase
MNNFDVARARAETPGCEAVLHFNAAGASLPPRCVVEAQKEYIDLEAQMGGYEAAEVRHDDIEHTYDAIAKLIHCQRDEIAVIENATRAWDMAFYAIDFKPGDRILTAQAEYGANYIAYLQMAKRTGATIEVIPNDESGQVSVWALRQMMNERVKLISVTHVPTNGGLVNPAVDIGAVARSWGCLYLLDACQSVGQMPIDVNGIGCDILSATSRKYLRGPRGTGFLYVRRAILDQLEPPLLDLHAATWVSRDRYEIRNDARRFENWETNYAAKIGLGVAVDYALTWGLDAIWARVSTLAEHFRARMTEIAGVTVRDLGQIRCGIVTFTVDGKDLAKIKTALAALHPRINVTTTSPFGTRLDMEVRGLSLMIRASLHYYNDEGEIERFCRVLEEML